MRNSYKDTYAKFYNKGRQAALVKLASNGVPDFLDPNRPTVEDKPVSFLGDLNSKITSGNFGPAPAPAPAPAPDFLGDLNSKITSGNFGPAPAPAQAPDFLGDLNSKITSGNFGPAPRLAPDFLGDLSSKITSGNFGPAPGLAPGAAGVTSGYGDFLGDLSSKITAGNFGPAPGLAPGAASTSGNIRPIRRSRRRLTPQQLLAKVNPGRNTRYRPAIDQDRLNRALGNSSAQASSMDRAGYRDMMRSMGYM